MKSLGTAVTDADPEVAATVRLLHRRRGWIWATVISVVAWVTVAGLMGALAPNASGAGEGVAAVFVLLLQVPGQNPAVPATATDKEPAWPTRC